ncbi:spondin domain-containing protein [Thalassotalea nanhaiensis]|uniref:Spondin domain-containing protein n=1 Tax=Thalassotalea nanhaiensis TaxID=3065648 RepID=A0ABY9TQ08_9GAMM|nr:spondin domain-containing protein [Colwelliaceae bacterium SQ345]
MFSKINSAKFANFPLVAASSLLLLTGCDGDSYGGSDSPTVTLVDPVTVTYEVSVVNLTHAQPMSPIAVVLHNDGQLWQIGEMASTELEVLAESGDNSGVLALEMVLASSSTEGILMPGMTETLTVSSVEIVPSQLSLATMLVNTNDAFTGINSMSLTNLAVGESISIQTSSYDSGTEKNSELKNTIPGPAGGGEGFNSERDDVDFVAMHPGVVSMDDGLMLSALDSSHRFDNPTLRVTVTRTE